MVVEVPTQRKKRVEWGTPPDPSAIEEMQIPRSFSPRKRGSERLGMTKVSGYVSFRDLCEFFEIM